MNIDRQNHRYCSATMFLLIAGMFLASLCRAAPDDDMSAAQKAFDRGDVVAAMSLYRRAAEQGYAPAQARLAYLFDYSEDDKKAVSWYRKAAEQKNNDGEYGLATMYAKGEGVPKDHRQAVELFTRAANNGHLQAIRVLAEAYVAGTLGLEPDPAQARSWLQRGAELGDTWSKSKLTSDAK